MLPAALPAPIDIYLLTAQNGSALPSPASPGEPLNGHEPPRLCRDTWEGFREEHVLV